jgi:hypothetical protein
VLRCDLPSSFTHCLHAPVQISSDRPDPCGDGFGCYRSWHQCTLRAVSVQGTRPANDSVYEFLVCAVRGKHQRTLISILRKYRWNLLLATIANFSTQQCSTRTRWGSLLPVNKLSSQQVSDHPVQTTVRPCVSLQAPKRTALQIYGRTRQHCTV